MGDELSVKNDHNNNSSNERHGRITRYTGTRYSGKKCRRVTQNMKERKLCEDRIRKLKSYGGPIEMKECYMHWEITKMWYN